MEYAYAQSQREGKDSQFQAAHDHVGQNFRHMSFAKRIRKGKIQYAKKTRNTKSQRKNDAGQP